MTGLHELGSSLRSIAYDPPHRQTDTYGNRVSTAYQKLPHPGSSGHILKEPQYRPPQGSNLLPRTPQDEVLPSIEGSARSEKFKTVYRSPGSQIIILDSPSKSYRPAPEVQNVDRLTHVLARDARATDYQLSPRVPNDRSFLDNGKIYAVQQPPGSSGSSPNFAQHNTSRIAGSTPSQQLRLDTFEQPVSQRDSSNTDKTDGPRLASGIEADVTTTIFRHPEPHNKRYREVVPVTYSTMPPNHGAPTQRRETREYAPPGFQILHEAPTRKVFVMQEPAVQSLFKGNSERTDQVLGQGATVFPPSGDRRNVMVSSQPSRFVHADSNMHAPEYSRRTYSQAPNEQRYVSERRSDIIPQAYEAERYREDYRPRQEGGPAYTVRHASNFASHDSALPRTHSRVVSTGSFSRTERQLQGQDSSTEVIVVE